MCVCNHLTYPVAYRPYVLIMAAADFNNFYLSPGSGPHSHAVSCRHVDAGGGCDRFVVVGRDGL